MNKLLFSLASILLFNQIILAQNPTLQASNLTITSRTESSLSATWTRGNGEKVLVVCRPVSSSTVTPTNGQGSTYYYSGSTTYGAGENLGSSNFAIYNGTGTG